MLGHARLRESVYSVAALLSRTRSCATSWCRSTSQRASVTRLVVSARLVHGQRSASPESSAARAYFSELRTRLSVVRLEDLESVLQLVDHVPTPGLEVEGWKVVIFSLAGADTTFLRALLESPSFQPWIPRYRLGAIACARLLELMFRSRHSEPTAADVQARLEQLQDRGGKITGFIRSIVADGFRRRGVAIPPLLAQTLTIDASPVTSTTNVVEHARFLRVEQGESMHEALSHVLPHALDPKEHQRLMIVLMDQDVYEIEEVEWMAAQLHARPNSHVWSRAVHNAIKCTSGTSAAIEVFNYARSQGALISYSATQHLMKALIGDANFRLPRPDQLQLAIKLFWLQMWESPPDERPQGHPVLLSVLSASLATPERWRTINTILAFLKANDIPFSTSGRPEYLAVSEAIYRSRSHSAAFDTISDDLSLYEFRSAVHLVLRIRFDDAPIVAYEDYRTFLDNLESRGRQLDDDLVKQYINAVFHSVTLLDMERDWLEARGSSVEALRAFGLQNLLRLEQGILRERPHLATPSVRAASLAVYRECGRSDLSGLWEDLLAHDAVSDVDVIRVLHASSTRSDLLRMWAVYISSHPNPSTGVWAAFADFLCGKGAREQAFEVIRDHLGDDAFLRKPAIVLFAMSRQDELERYARALPKTWQNPRTRQEIATLREHRLRSTGARYLFPQTYDFAV